MDTPTQQDRLVPEETSLVRGWEGTPGRGSEAYLGTWLSLGIVGVLGPRQGVLGNGGLEGRSTG